MLEHLVRLAKAHAYKQLVGSSGISVESLGGD